VSLKSDLKESSEDFIFAQKIENIEIHDKKLLTGNFVEVTDIEHDSFFHTDNITRRSIPVMIYKNRSGKTVFAAYNQYSKILHIFI
jgi:hypothetical protein